MIKMSRKAKKAMAVALTAGMLASTAATPVMAATAGWKQNATGWWYENADGTYPANKWEKLGGKWYHFDANGYMESGWKKINGKWYYLGSANDGAMKDGWFKDTTGKWFYAVPNDGAIYQNAWKQEPNGDWYYLDPNGYMCEGGWVPTGGKWYFFDNEGVMQTGTIKIENEGIYHLTDNGDMVTDEYKINGVTYKFTSTGEATGDTLPTATKAFKKDGTPIALEEEKRELSITSATAITKNESGDFVVTVLLNQNATAENLKDTTLTLTNGSNKVTATFVSVNEGKAVYKITNKSALTPGNSSVDGAYTVTADGIDVTNGVTAEYTEALAKSAVQGIVYYVNDSGEYVPIDKATIKVGNTTVKTDAFGYYSVAATPGYVTVEVSADGFFGQEVTSVKVSNNDLTALNVMLKDYEQEKLYITGIVTDDTVKSKSVVGAKVELKVKKDGKFDTIATVTTDPDGKYLFENSAAASSYTTNPTAKKTFGVNDDNKLSEKNEYQIVISKDYNAKDADGKYINLTDAYHSATYAVEMNQTGAETAMNIKTITPIKAINDIEVALSWNEDIKFEEDATTGVKVYFKDQNGKDTLNTSTFTGKTVKDNKIDTLELVKATESDNFKTAAPTLPVGKYALVVFDDTNAYKVIQVEVTEEGKMISAEGEIQEATAKGITTSVDEIGADANKLYTTGADKTNVILNSDSGLALDTTSGESADYVSIKYDVYETVNGMDVLIQSPDVDFKTTVTTNEPKKATFSAETDVLNIEEGKKYKCVPSGANIREAATITVTGPNDGASSTDETPKVKSAAKVIKLDLSDVEFRKPDNSVMENAAAGKPSKVKILSVTIKDANGKVVAEANENVDGYKDGEGSTIADEINISDVFKDKNDLTGIAPGKYTAEIKLDGYETVTTKEFDLVDFHAATVSAAGSSAKKIQTTAITGTFRYESGEAVKVDATIVVYDDKGIVVAAKEYDKNGAYTITNGENAKLSAGTYTVVVRSNAFETVVLRPEIKADSENNLPIKVKKRTNGGTAVLKVIDSNNIPYGVVTKSNDTVKQITLRDAYYVKPDDDVLDKNNYLKGLVDADDDNTAVIGEYEALSNKGTSTKEYVVENILSVGKYSIWVEANDTARASKGEYSVEVSTVAATSYKNVTLVANSEKNTTKLTVNFSASDAAAIDTKFDWVVVEDTDGNIVAAKKEGDIDDDSVAFDLGVNKTYVVKVYANDTFVGSKTVTVQDFETSINVALDDADNK